MKGPSYFEIQANDIKRAANFYKEVFGWKYEKINDLTVEYWRIEADGLRGGLMKRLAPIPKSESGTNAYVCSMEVVDFDETAEKILNLGGKIALPKFAVPGVCWQGYFLDTEGNTFGIFQPDPYAR